MSTHVRVRFLMDFRFEDKGQKTRLLTLYGARFFAMVKEAKGRKYFSMDYEQLPGIRQLLCKTGGVDKLLPAIRNRVPEANLMRLMDVAPLFNLASTNLQAFILLGLGLRGTE
jgi:hypothetical protein